MVNMLKLKEHSKIFRIKVRKIMANILKQIIENDKRELRRRKWLIRFLTGSQMAAMSDEELKAKTDEFKERYNKGESLDSLLYEALQ